MVHPLGTDDAGYFALSVTPLVEPLGIPARQSELHVISVIVVRDEKKDTRVKTALSVRIETPDTSETGNRPRCAVQQ
jgi:hypothetical protein